MPTADESATSAASSGAATERRRGLRDAILARLRRTEPSPSASSSPKPDVASPSDVAPELEPDAAARRSRIRDAPVRVAVRESLFPFASYFSKVKGRIQEARARNPSRRLPRTPFARVWPLTRELWAIMVVATLFVLVAPPPFERLPRPFDVRDSEPPAAQATAAVLGALAVALTFLVQFSLYAWLYVRSLPRLVHAFVTFWMAVSIGGPLTLLLLRVAAALQWPLDWPTAVVLVANLSLPGTMLAWDHATRERFARCRQLFGALLAVLVAWLFAHVPYPMLIAILGAMGLLDVLLVALPCCSPVQALDKLYYQRAREGVPSMPGLTFQEVPSEDDGLFLGLGDFIVFSVFCGHCVRTIGAAPTALVAAGLLAGLVLLLIHVALKWPLRALEPAIPLSVVLAALLLVAERFALRFALQALALARVSTL